MTGPLILDYTIQPKPMSLTNYSSYEAVVAAEAVAKEKYGTAQTAANAAMKVAYVAMGAMEGDVNLLADKAYNAAIASGNPDIISAASKLMRATWDNTTDFVTVAIEVANFIDRKANDVCNIAIELYKAKRDYHSN